MACNPDQPTPDPFDPEQRDSAAQVQTRLEARLRSTHLGDLLAARGITTVALDERGEMTEYRPDGTSAPVRR